MTNAELVALGFPWDPSTSSREENILMGQAQIAFDNAAQAAGMTTEEFARQEAPVLTDPFSFAPISSGNGAPAWFNAIGNIIGQVGSILGAPGGASSTPMALGGQLPIPGDIILQNPGNPVIPRPQVIQAAGLACSVKRRRYKIQRQADGTIAAVAYCIPRRMNPLNPRALARAGRRVASFSRIAQGMQKMLEKSCRIGLRGKRTSRSRSYSCAPKGCR